jgi:hypothetical protein
MSLKQYWQSPEIASPEVSPFLRERSTQRMIPRANTFGSDSFKPLLRDDSETRKDRFLMQLC